MRWVGFQSVLDNAVDNKKSYTKPTCSGLQQGLISFMLLSRAHIFTMGMTLVHYYVQVVVIFFLGKIKGTVKF